MRSEKERHKIGVAGFTKRGRLLADRLAKAFAGEYEIIRYEEDLKEWCRTCFASAQGIIFVGACGIAVRTIAPFLKDKTTDPAVLVIDEKGQYVISLLSGHIGGANELAAAAAARIDAVPVITTASDVNGLLAVDVFAKKNRLAIASMTDAKKIAAALLREEKTGVYCSGMVEGEIPPELTWIDPKRELEDDEAKVEHLIWISQTAPAKEQCTRYLKRPDGTVLHLIPQNTVLGIGCRRGKSQEEIVQTVRAALEESGVSEKAVRIVSSIDLKKDEPGILNFCQERGLKYVTWTAQELLSVPGEFDRSAFVEKTTGVDNVCERAALLAAGPGGRLIRKKYAENGVTAALAVREWRVRFEA